MQDKVICRTPTPNKKPTRIDKWKFDLIHNAILEILPIEGNGILFKDLPNLVKEKITIEKLEKLGSLKWYVVSVKLEMEVRKEIYRVQKSSPQRLLKSND